MSDERVMTGEAVVDAFLDAGHEVRVDARPELARLVDEHVAALRAKLDAAERELAFARRDLAHTEDMAASRDKGMADALVRAEKAEAELARGGGGVAMPSGGDA